MIGNDKKNKAGKLKARLHKGGVTIGSWLTLGNTLIAEMMANMGFDWLAIDMEHSPTTESEAQHLIQVIDLCGVAPLVRVGGNDPLIIKKVMDAGSEGVIVPMINTGSDAQKAVNAVKYPPIGTRGVGLARAQEYGIGFDRYKSSVNKDSIVIAQIEHIEAVENLEEILGCEGIDGFIVGPYDLSASLGVPGEFTNPKFLKALGKIKEVSGKYKIPSGYHVIQPDAKLVGRKIKEGYRFIGFSLDALFLASKCKQELRSIMKRGK